MRVEMIQKILRDNKANYNLIAKDFTRTRPFVSPDLKSLVNYTLKGGKILDSGCAHGRLFEILKERNVDYYGIDISENLIEIAKKKYPQAKFFVSDALHLPFVDDFFDQIFSISVLHHIPTKKLQIQYLKEHLRVLKPNGSLVLRVWNLWETKKAWLPILKYTFLKLIGKSELDFKDIYYPWRSQEGDILALRYLHCFTKNELKHLIEEAGFELLNIFRDNSSGANIYAIAEK